MSLLRIGEALIHNLQQTMNETKNLDTSSWAVGLLHSACPFLRPEGCGMKTAMDQIINCKDQRHNKALLLQCSSVHYGM